MNPKKIEYSKENPEMYPGNFKPGDTIQCIDLNNSYPFHFGYTYTVGLFANYKTLDWAICVENNNSLINHKDVYKKFELVKNEEILTIPEEDKGWGF